MRHGYHGRLMVQLLPRGDGAMSKKYVNPEPIEVAARKALRNLMQMRVYAAGGTLRGGPNESRLLQLAMAQLRASLIGKRARRW